MSEDDLEFAPDQDSKCAEFKLACESDNYDLSGDDWCEIPYKYYVPKRSLYPSQTECHSLKFLFDTWKGQLGTVVEGVPSPKWPSDPFTREVITIPLLMRLTDQWTSMGEELPEYIATLKEAITEDPELWAQTMGEPIRAGERRSPIEELLSETLGQGSYEAVIDVGDMANLGHILTELVGLQPLVIRDTLTEDQFDTFSESLNDTLQEVVNSPEFDELIIRIFGSDEPDPSGLVNFIGTKFVPIVNGILQSDNQPQLTNTQLVDLTARLGAWTQSALDLFATGVPIEKVGEAMDFIRTSKPVLQSTYPRVDMKDLVGMMADSLIDSMITHGDQQIPVSQVVRDVVDALPPVHNRQIITRSLQKNLNRVRTANEEE